MGKGNGELDICLQISKKTTGKNKKKKQNA
jgi:hypothetical protein